MHVVEAEHERARVGQTLEQIAQRAVGAMAVAGGGLARELSERRQRHAERGLVGEAELGQPPLAEVVQMAVERVGPEPVWQVALELRGAARSALQPSA